jgi:hypothetical protein
MRLEIRDKTIVILAEEQLVGLLPSCEEMLVQLYVKLARSELIREWKPIDLLNSAGKQSVFKTEVRSRLSEGNMSCIMFTGLTSPKGDAHQCTSNLWGRNCPWCESEDRNPRLLQADRAVPTGGLKKCKIKRESSCKVTTGLTSPN